MPIEPTSQTRESADNSIVAELLLIIGPSGSGKTTLLSLFGCVLYPTQGYVCIKGVDTKDLNERQLAHLRRTGEESSADTSSKIDMSPRQVQILYRPPYLHQNAFLQSPPNSLGGEGVVNITNSKS